jgi:DNA-binding response OmpR family regulator
MNAESKPIYRASILIIEDDERQLRHYRRTLVNYRLTTVPNGTAAIGILNSAKPDLIILDHILADGEIGTDFLPELKTSAAHVPIIIISGSLSVRAQLAALQGPHRAHYILEKPIDLDELDATVERALTDCGLGEMVRMLKSLESLEKIDANEPERRFTERIARQHSIAQRLGQSGEAPNLSRLAEEFKVDRKTIRTDLNDLRQRGQIDPRLYPGGAPEEG